LIPNHSSIRELKARFKKSNATLFDVYLDGKEFEDFDTRINSAVFPSLQGGPHNHAIAGVEIF